MDTPSEVLLIGGRSGVGKSAVAFELHALLSARRIRHGVIEGDNLDLAYPAPWKHGLAERNLRAMWSNYRELGYRRLIYTNTVSVLFARELAAAMGDGPRVTAVLLTASDTVAAARLRGRIQGSDLQAHLARGDAAAADLEARTPEWVSRCPTDGRTVAEVAAGLLSLTGWTEDAPAPGPPSR